MRANHPTTPASLQTAAPLQNAGSAVAAPLTPWQEKLFRRRQEKLRLVTEFLARGFSRTAAASESGIAISWLWTLEKRFRQHGLAGLIPKVSKGVAPLIAPSVYTADLVAELQRLAVRLGGPRAACRIFVKDATCPEPLREYILKRDALPDALRKLIGYRRGTGTIRRAGRFFHVERIGQEQQAA